MKQLFFKKYMPELADLPKNEQDRLWRENYFKGYKHWQTWFGFLLMLIWSFLVFLFIDYLRDEVFKYKSNIFATIYSIFGFGIGYLFYWIIFIRMVRSHIRKARNK